MRSKLLALHLIHSLLITHLPVFLSAAPVLFSSHRDGDLELMHFIHAVKQYLFLSLSRNTVSVVPQVFDVAVDIFGRVLASLRHLLKKELAVLLTEIIVPILEAKGSITFHQRSSLVRSLLKLYSDPKLNGGQILVEIYLNYDCDVNASVRENVWERTVTALSKLVTQHVGEKQGSREKMSTLLASTTSSDDLVLPQITTANLGNMSRDQIRDLMSSNGDFVELKKRSLELLVNGILQPLIEWAEQRSRIQESIMSPSLDNGSVDFELASHAGTAFIENDMLNVAPTEDDPSAFESIKQKKKLLWKGVQKFNTNSKKGMSFLHESGVLGKKGDDIAKFLFSQNGLNKSALGEYLGQGEQEFIDIMHKFVDMFKFEGLAFVDALRTFLQSFRLPGEAQKIDRFMLKFADRYVKSNPNKFESAGKYSATYKYQSKLPFPYFKIDTAYVLAYSVIMLNTDLHNQQVKTKMTKEDFIKNNRGIDNGNDIPKDYLEQIYNEINGNEIVMKDERLRAAETESKKDAVMQFAMTSENMAQKTEALLNTLMGAKGDQGQFESGAPNSDSGISSNFYAATHYEHIKPMMELVWLGVLAGVSGPLQDSDDPEVVNLALEGFKYAVRISSMFGMDLEMKAYISTLSKWTQLSNLTESKAQKNLAAVRVFLEIANTEGNNLHEIWRQVVKCVSQLEKLQVLAREDQDKGSFQQR